MAREWENDCVGCPQGCIHCGREKDYEVVYCDVCGDNQEEMYMFKDSDYCEEHLFEAWVNWGGGEFDLNLIDDEDITQEEKEEYLNDLLSNVALNHYELIDLLSAESAQEWEDLKNDCRLDLEREDDRW